MNNCQRCGKKLVAIGSSRKNGTEFFGKTKAGSKDWATRKYHKKCWADHLLYLEGLRMTQEYIANHPEEFP